MSRPPDLVQGTLDALILSIVADEPLPGWAISQRLRAKSAHVLQVSQGSLYPALHKLDVLLGDPIRLPLLLSVRVGGS